jgi:hypothetical protein
VHESQAVHHSAFDKTAELHWWTCGDNKVNGTTGLEPGILSRTSQPCTRSPQRFHCITISHSRETLPITIRVFSPTSTMLSLFMNLLLYCCIISKHDIARFHFSLSNYKEFNTECNEPFIVLFSLMHRYTRSVNLLLDCSNSTSPNDAWQYPSIMWPQRPYPCSALVIIKNGSQCRSGGKIRGAFHAFKS